MTSYPWLLLAVVLATVAQSTPPQSAAPQSAAPQSTPGPPPPSTQSTPPQSRPAKPKKVYTNDDIGTAHDAPPLDLGKVQAPRNEKEKDELGTKLAVDVARQKKEIASLEEHADRLAKIEEEVRKARAQPTVTAETCKQEPERCETRRQAALDLARTNTSLNTARQRLEQTQEKARKLGYPSSVWDAE